MLFDVADMEVVRKADEAIKRYTRDFPSIVNDQSNWSIHSFSFFFSFFCVFW